LRRLGRQGRQHHIRADKQLPPKPPPIRAIQPHILRLDAQRLGQTALAPGDHLVRCPDGQLFAFP
jgi:hypothetical protein